METLLNYIYWQTLAINQFDDISHILRTANFIIEDCSDIQNDLRVRSLGGDDSDQDIRERCGGYLGPYNPGIMNPDPTDPDGGRIGFEQGQDGSSGASADPVPLRKTLPGKPGERREAGDPAALPLPGQFDPSVPHVTLPPGLQELMNSAPRGGGDNRVPSGEQATQMLDFLLGP
jgi:hypothetical protein